MKCKCGCGQIVKKGNTWVNGHNAKMNSSEYMRRIAIKGNKERVISDETRRKLSLCRMGEKSVKWKGGITYETYCSAWADAEYKESIKQRDGYKCLNPSCYKTSTKLTLHHINYNKKDCRPINLITLCNSCNTGANSNRRWHKQWYKAILYRRYGLY